MALSFQQSNIILNAKKTGIIIDVMVPVVICHIVFLLAVV
jgi:hypothetical protein